jgi:hypothetical protein
MFGCAPRRSSGLLLATVALALVACERPTVPPSIDAEPGRLAVHANLSATTIATIVVKVTAPDIPTPLVFNMQIASGVASGSIVIAAGSGRKIELDAFDANQIQTHHGERSNVTVVPGVNPAMTIVLVPTTGDQPVTAQLGTFIVTVSPASATLTLGGTSTVQLVVTIRDNATPTPNTITPGPGDVTWATTHPAFFTVDGNGLVTGVKAGIGSVVATYNGFAGTSTITVQ